MPPWALADMLGAWLIEHQWMSFSGTVVLDAGVIAAVLLAVPALPALFSTAGMRV